MVGPLHTIPITEFLLFNQKENSIFKKNNMNVLNMNVLNFTTGILEEKDGFVKAECVCAM